MNSISSHFGTWSLGSRSNRPQSKSASSQIGPRSNHCIIMLFVLFFLFFLNLFNLIIYIVNCVVYLIPNQIIVLLCCFLI